MKDKNIKERYNKAIDAFKSRIEKKEGSTIFKIEKIENEYDEYNKKSIKDKVNLGLLVLAGTTVTALASSALFLDTNSFELEIAKDMFFVLGISLGASMIPISIDNYRKDRLNSNIDADKSLKEYEDVIEKEKVNVKRR